MNWRELLNYYERLSSRERMLVGLAGGAVLIALLYSLVWEPLAEAQENARKRIALKERQLAEITQLRQTYYDLAAQLEGAERLLMDEKGFSLFQHIEATVGDVVGRNHIVSMNPQSEVIAETYREEAVEVKLVNITLEQLIDMMHRIEKGNYPLRVTKLHVKEMRDPHFLEVTAVVSMLQAVRG